MRRLWGRGNRGREGEWGRTISTLIRAREVLTTRSLFVLLTHFYSKKRMGG